MKNITLERNEDGSYQMVEAETAEMHQEPAPVAKLEQFAALDKITNIELMGVPVGAAAIGSAMAILVDRVAIAKLDPTNKWGSWANFAAAFVVGKYGGKLVGKKTAEMTALILTYEAVADWVTMGLNKVWPGSATMQQNYAPQYSVLKEAQKVADSNYYGAAFGG